MSEHPWPSAPLGSLFSVFGGGTPSTGELANWSGEIPWATSADLTAKGEITARRFVTTKGLEGSATTVVPAGSVVVATRVGLGKVALAKEPVAFSQDCQGLVFDDSDLDPRFVCHQMRWIARNFQAVSQGTTISGITKKQLATSTFFVPSLKEQKRTADKLDELYSDLDAGVASLQRAQANLKRYRASVLKAAVEGRLTAEWRHANPPSETGAELMVRLLRERREHWEAAQLTKFETSGKAPPKDWRKKYVEPAAPDTSKLPALPVGWCWASAETLCGFITKGTTPHRSQWRDRSDFDAVPFVRVTNLTTSGQLDAANLVFVSRSAHESALGRSLVLPGDVLMNIVGPPLGQVSIVPASFSQWNMNQAVAVFRPVVGMDVAFFCNFLLSHTAQTWLGERAKTSAGQVNLTLELCRALPVPVPPISEQCAISRLVENADAATVRSLAAVEQGLIRSRALRQATLKHAFAGKLVPQDPTDEPAAVLLERIRAAHAAAPAKPRKPRRPTAKAKAAKAATVARPPRKRRGSV